MATGRAAGQSKASIATWLRRHPFVTSVANAKFKTGRVALADSVAVACPRVIRDGAAKQLEWLASRTSPIVVGDAPYRILDLDAGIGRVGLAIASAFPPRAVRVAMSDRDRLAMALLGWTTALSGLAPSVELLGAGLGYGPARSAKCDAFDLVLVRLPDGLRRRAIRELLLGAGSLLKDDGLVAFTHGRALREDVASVFALNEEQKGWVEVVREARSTRVDLRVWRIRRSLPDPRLEHDPLFPWRVLGPERAAIGSRRSAPFVTVMGVLEREALSPASATVLEALRTEAPRIGDEARERILVLEPGHGLLALQLIDAREPRELAVLSRDTLSIAVAIRNVDLAREQWRIDRKVALTMPAVRSEVPFLPAADPSYDLIVGTLRADEGGPALAITLESIRAALVPGKSSLALVAFDGKQLATVKKAASRAGLRVGRGTKRDSIVVLALRLGAAARR